MTKVRVIEEIDRRIRRLEEEMKLIEERMTYLEENSVRYEFRRRDYSVYYLLFMGAWMILGVLALLAVRKDAPYLNFPLAPYILISLAVLLTPVLYILWSRREAPPDPVGELAERQRLARRVVKEFYLPLRAAVENNDTRTMMTLANRLLDDPSLANAFERTGEGDAKLSAYALYLYANYSPELDEEVRELLGRLSNKPLRALLEDLG